jgi:hypothetical protein
VYCQTIALQKTSKRVAPNGAKITTQSRLIVFYLPNLVITSQRDVPYHDTMNTIGGKCKDKFYTIINHEVTDGD